MLGYDQFFSMIVGKKMTKLSKNAKYPILGQLLRKFGQKLIFHKDQPHSLLGSVVSKLHAKNQKKLMSQF